MKEIIDDTIFDAHLDSIHLKRVFQEKPRMRSVKYKFKISTFEKSETVIFNCTFSPQECFVFFSLHNY